MFGEALEKVAANSSSSKMVYAYDNAGNQVALGLIVDGSFDDYESGISRCPKINEEYFAIPENEINWVGANEECVVTCGDQGQFVKNELPEDSSPDTLSGSTKKQQLGVVKIYKSRKTSRKTLNEIKRNLQAERKNKKQIQNRSLKLKVKLKATMHGQQKKMQKSRRKKSKKKIDAAYRPPTSVKHLGLQSK